MRLQDRMPKAVLVQGQEQRPALSSAHIEENRVTASVHFARPARKAVLPLDAILPPAISQACNFPTSKRQAAKRQVQANGDYWAGRFIRPGPP